MMTPNNQDLKPDAINFAINDNGNESPTFHKSEGLIHKTQILDAGPLS